MQIKRLKFRFEGKKHNIDLSMLADSRLDLDKLEILREHIQFCEKPITKCVVEGKFLDDAEMSNFAKLLEENHIEFRYDQLKKCESKGLEFKMQQNKPTQTRAAQPQTKSFFSSWFSKNQPTRTSENTSLIRNTDSVPMQDLHYSGNK
ncbi:MAG: hypothetical protein M3R00_05715 [Pseudomonadota bacterium]|nr:hypothetical protein [Pseudomonadota bacterium]